MSVWVECAGCKRWHEQGIACPPPTTASAPITIWRERMAELFDDPRMVRAREVDRKYRGDLDAEIADLRAAGHERPHFPWDE